MSRVPPAESGTDTSSSTQTPPGPAGGRPSEIRRPLRVVAGLKNRHRQSDVCLWSGDCGPPACSVAENRHRRGEVGAGPVGGPLKIGPVGGLTRKRRESRAFWVRPRRLSRLAAQCGFSTTYQPERPREPNHRPTSPPLLPGFQPTDQRERPPNSPRAPIGPQPSPPLVQVVAHRAGEVFGDRLGPRRVGGLDHHPHERLSARGPQQDAAVFPQRGFGGADLLPERLV
jgi:hypothetical protein